MKKTLEFIFNKTGDLLICLGIIVRNFSEKAKEFGNILKKI